MYFDRNDTISRYACVEDEAEVDPSEYERVDWMVDEVLEDFWENIQVVYNATIVFLTMKIAFE